MTLPRHLLVRLGLACAATSVAVAYIQPGACVLAGAWLGSLVRETWRFMDAAEAAERRSDGGA